MIAGIDGFRAFESVTRCIGCGHVPHDPKKCGAHAVIVVERCRCDYDRTQTYAAAV